MSRLRNISNFENEWSNAMGNASVQPPDRVWNRIEVALDNPGTSSGNKRGYLLIPLLAAASISLALAATAVWNSDWWSNPSQVESLASEQVLKAEDGTGTVVGEDGQLESGDSTMEESSFADSENSSEPGVESEPKGVGGNQFGATENSNPVEIAGKDPKASNKYDDLAVLDEQVQDEDASGQSFADIPPSTVTGDEEGRSTVADRLDPMYAAIEVGFEQPEVRPVAMLLASRRTNLGAWTGMNLAAASYDPNSGGEAFGGLALAQNDFESNTASAINGLESGENIGSSLSIGVGAGFDLSKKWLLQGGISYLRNQNYGFSNAFNPANGQLLRSLGSDQQFTTLGQPVEYRSEVSFISVPVQMGYYLVNQKFTWILSSGVSSDVFLGDNVTGQGVTYNFNQSPGAASDYNPVHFNLLLGTEFGYTIHERYRLSVSPTLRHGITPVFKSDTGLNNRPIILNVGFRFNYIFR